jgi:hypothetical protein
LSPRQYRRIRAENTTITSLSERDRRTSLRSARARRTVSRRADRGPRRPHPHRTREASAAGLLGGTRRRWLSPVLATRWL